MEYFFGLFRVFGFSFPGHLYTWLLIWSHISRFYVKPRLPYSNLLIFECIRVNITMLATFVPVQCVGRQWCLGWLVFSELHAGPFVALLTTWRKGSFSTQLGKDTKRESTLHGEAGHNSIPAHLFLRKSMLLAIQSACSFSESEWMPASVQMHEDFFFSLSYSKTTQRV